MTKNYSKEVDDIHNQIANSQENLFQLLEKVTKERDTLDMEKDRLERRLLATEKELLLTSKRMKELESMYADLRGRQDAYDRIVRIGNDMSMKMEEDSRQERARLNKTISSLQHKLNVEAVELTVIIEKIKTRAKTHGITAAGSMFDTVCLLLGDVTAWQKNKGDLESFFAEYNEKKNGNENHFNIEKVDQMAVGDDATLNHGI